MDVANNHHNYENAGQANSSVLNNGMQFSTSHAPIENNSSYSSYTSGTSLFPTLSKQQRKKLLFLRRERAKLRENVKHKRKLAKLKQMQPISSQNININATNQDLSHSSQQQKPQISENGMNSSSNNKINNSNPNNCNHSNVCNSVESDASHSQSGQKGDVISRNLKGFERKGCDFVSFDEIAPDSCILSFLVFDEDTFTPDDFLGSAEIRLDNIPYDTVTDMWIPLNNVDTGHIHIKLRKCILASPMHRSIVKKLSTLQRGITIKDLQMNNISLDQLIGQEAYICENLSNPAIEHLVSVLLANKIEWNLSSLHRIETILTSQHMLPTQLCLCLHELFLWSF